MRVETVTGPIDDRRLGRTLVHEHMLVRDEAIHSQFPNAGTVGGIPEGPVAPGGEFDAAVHAAAAARRLGFDTICDPTAPLIGRDVDFLRRVSEQSGVALVACTGLYTYDHLPEFFANRSADEIVAFLVDDLTEGAQGTSIKAGFLKCAADEPGMTPNVRKVHRAVARASLQTGAAIMAHSHPGAGTGPIQLDLFEEEGVEPARVQIAHCGDTADLDYVERILDRGAYAGMDRYGLEICQPFEARNATVLRLLERGYVDQLLLGADSCATLDWYPPAAAAAARNSGEVKRWDITMVAERVIPALVQGGATETQIETMLVANPRRWLTAGRIEEAPLEPSAP